jgi:hypothetical protein
MDFFEKRLFMSLLQILQQHLSGDVVNRISSRIGADPGTTGNAIDAALPLLISALARNAQDPAQARSLATAVDQDHNGAILEDVPRHVSAPDEQTGAGILRHVLGGNQQTVQSGLSKATGLDANKVGSLLTTLAPLVMGALGRAKQENGLDERGLSTLLTKEQQHLSQSAPGAMSALSRLLDRNSDGSVVDEISGILGQTFGGKR